LNVQHYPKLLRRLRVNAGSQSTARYCSRSARQEAVYVLETVATLDAAKSAFSVAARLVDMLSFNFSTRAQLRLVPGRLFVVVLKMAAAISGQPGQALWCGCTTWPSFRNNNPPSPWVRGRQILRLHLEPPISASSLRRDQLGVRYRYAVHRKSEPYNERCGESG
jgi:hypothetical protein